MSFTHNDICKVDLRWQVGNIGLAVNVFQAKLLQDTPHTVSDLATMTTMGDWMTRILEPMQPDIVVDCDILDCQLYQKVGALWNLVGPCPVVFTPESIGDPLPSGVAALITAYTYVSKVIGKKYLPGLSELGQTAGLWVAGVLSHMLASGVEWISGFDDVADSTSHWYPGVWSLKTVGFQSFAPSVATRDVPAYQRRRKAGVGV